MSEWELFYEMQPEPAVAKEARQKFLDFTTHHISVSKSKLLALVTSGGTTVPLEHNMVRFVDNFSGGTRGAASAEYLVESGYSVIFLYRQNTLKPFTRQSSGLNFLDMLDISVNDAGYSPSDVINVKPECVDTVAPILKRYQEIQNTGKLLCLPFTTLTEYLWLLRAACECLSELGPSCLLYLAAAVSDFYIPSNQMPMHKMQSAEGAPIIQLQLVPKMLSPLVSIWVPEAYVVSFKLETDEDLLIAKSRDALNKYKHKLVVANSLHNRRHTVTFVHSDDSRKVTLDPKEIEMGVEIESTIIKYVTKKHGEYIKHMNTKS